MMQLLEWLKSGYSAAWSSAFDWGSKGREFKSLYPDHFFCFSADWISGRLLCSWAGWAAELVRLLRRRKSTVSCDSQVSDVSWQILREVKIRNFSCHVLLFQGWIQKGMVVWSFFDIFGNSHFPSQANSWSFATVTSLFREVKSRNSTVYFWVFAIC